MISAKDEFFLEREEIEELNNLINGSDLTHRERDEIDFNLSKEQFEQLKQVLIHRQVDALERLKRGNYVNMGDINQAVKKSADRE